MQSKHHRSRRLAQAALAVGLIGCAAGLYAGVRPDARNAVRVWWLEQHGENPYPVHLRRPPAYAPSPVANLGRMIFFDPGLSASGKQSCASCHDPAHAYGPPDDRPAQLGGPALESQGLRAAPTLTYLAQVPPFSIGADSDDDGGRRRGARHSAPRSRQARAPKLAGQAPDPAAMVPQGGLFWDGRANSLQEQALGPLLNPLEMANADAQALDARLSRAPYADQLARLFGAANTATPQMRVNIALSALAHFEVEDPSFHAYTSKFDYWLEGRVRFTPAEMRGYLAFNDTHRGNCGACHTDAPRADNQPPLLTDNQYEALAVPRNPELEANSDPNHFDLGICGPIRSGQQEQSQYCGMFRTPSLRNVALRKVFFHNGRYHSLQEVMDFYDFRDTAPERIYPRDGDGRIIVFDDLPPSLHANVDTRDAPFDRKAGDPPPMSAQDLQDIITFLQTLTDGYQPAG